MKHECKKEALEKQGISYPNLCYLFRIHKTGNDYFVVECVDCGECFMVLEELRGEQEEGR